MKKSKEIEIRSFLEAEGNLSVLESNIDVDFVFKRIFYIYGVNTGVVRGRHANKRSRFIMFTVSGSCEVKVDDGIEKESFMLNTPSKGLFIDNCTWKEMYNFSEDCVLVVISDTQYDKTDYIYEYNEFLDSINRR